MNNLKPPFDSLYWNVAQLYAWAFLRDADLVQKAAEWHENNHIRVCCLPKFKEAGWNLPKADREVLRHLKSGKLRCKGLENNFGDHAEIPQVQWQRLAFFTEHEKTYASFGRMPKIGSTKWYDLLFRLEDILEIWPVCNLKSAMQKRARGRKKGDGAYKDDIYLQKMADLINSGKAKSSNHAAGIVANNSQDKPQGHSEYAIRDRLARKYRAQIIGD